jgi:hypothetical protein
MSQEPIEPGTDYWEVVVLRQSDGQFFAYQLKNWEHIAAGIAAVYPDLNDVKEIRMNRYTA